MPFEFSTGDEIRAAALRGALRGYDKTDVEDFREAVAGLVDDLRRRLDAATGHLSELGLDDPVDLKNEFETVGREVSAILETARRAATELRARANADAERWREEADADAARMRTEAWEEGSAQLEESVAEAAQTRADADEDALFIRAQAEKEAIRLTSEAKRDADEAVRTARAEAEAIVAAARGDAAAAQERTRALEVRREELMGELEEARKAIGMVEARIEADKGKLLSPETTTVRVIGGRIEPPQNDDQDEDGWLDDDNTVRLVRPDPAPGRSGRPTPPDELEPVLDADDIVAEVEQLQVEPTSVDDPWRSGTVAVTAETPAEEPVIEVPMIEEPDSSLAEGAEPSVEPMADEHVAKEPVADEADVKPIFDETAAPDRPVDVTTESADEPGEPGEPAPMDTEEPAEIRTDGLADLFASLRTPGTPTRPGDNGAAGVEEAAIVDTSPEPDGERVTALSEPTGSSSPAVFAESAPALPAESAASEPAPREPVERASSAADPFEERERIVLPILNRNLREVKKQILEFQNVMLEATKADPDGWRPDAEEYRLALDPHVQALVDEVHKAAGGAGASPLRPGFGADLHDAVTAAVQTMLGSGYRETSATLGRVYRTWRSDEAERRMTELAMAAHASARSGVEAGSPQ